jgi:cytochrome bd ubiquinol oxidase subunit II
MTDPVFLSELVLALGFVMYALFGGADFGGGIWTALASGPRKRQQREALFDAIGPVWETNHVWLIFVVVTMFTAFPTGFADLFIALMTPLVLALVGINFRGAAFAFRHFSRKSVTELTLSVMVFEIASILTPFALGMAVTAAAAGKITIVNGQLTAGFQAWINPFTLMGGLDGMAICAALAPVYMAVRVTGKLQEDFRTRSLVAGITLGVLAALTIPVAHYQSPLFAERLLHSGAGVFVALAVLGGLVSQLLLWRRLFLPAQIGVAGTVVMMLAGFAAAMNPDLIIGQLTFKAAAAPRPALVAFLSVLPLGAIILVPSLFYLYWTFRGEPDPAVPPDGSKS